MSNWRRALFGACIALAAHMAHGQACTQTLTAGVPPHLNAALEAATANVSVICLNAGTYTPSIAGTIYNDPNTFAIAKPGITLRGAPGTSPSQVILQGGGGNDYTLKIFGYGALGTPNNVTVKGLTINSAVGPGNGGGIQVFDFQVPNGRLSGLTLQDLVINTRTDGIAHGVLLRLADRVVMDNVTITSQQTAFNLLDVTDSLLINSTVTRTGAAGLSVIGGARNVIAGNTIGTPKAVLGTYSFPTGAVVFYNTIGNRFENNVVQGMQFDGVDWTALDGVPFGLSAPQATQNSTDNYAGKNTVISTGFADGLPGGSAMWSNCSSNNTWLYGNDTQGSPECGVCVWTSRSNMLQANRLHNHGIAGIFASGGAETTGDCSNPAYRLKPVNNFLQSNSLFFNKNDQLIIRNADSQEVSRNYMASTDGFGGPPQACLASDTCQSALTVQTDSSMVSSGVGDRIVANISHDNKRGLLWTEPEMKTTGLQFYLNRILNEVFSRYTVPSTTIIDGGPNVGGSFWTQHHAVGNPSSSTPYSGVIDTANTNTIGKVVDRFPYETEDLGRGYGVTVFEPRAGSSVAAGTKRTVRWNAPGCTMVDALLDGSVTLLSNVGNTGYAIVTIPLATSVAAHTIQVRCKDSVGNLMGSANSPSFNVKSQALQLLAPGRDDVFNAGSQIWVAWKKDPAIASVTVDLSVNGGAFAPQAAGLTGSSTRITLPAGAAVQNAIIRVRSGSASEQDDVDGVFAIRGTGQGFTNVPAARTFVMGALERLEWTSPANSRVATITASVNGGAPVAVATDLPDRGFYDWTVPDLGVGNIVLTMRYEQSDATTQIGANVLSNSGVTRRAGTVTFSNLANMAVGGSQPVTATSNSGIAVTLSSLTPGVCTLASGTLNAVAQGTCTIQGSAAGNATYAATGNVTTSLVVSSDPPRLGNISTRMQVLTGNDVLIGGFVIGGSANKTVVVRARGPSLIPFGISNALINPVLQLVRSSDQSTVAINDDWVNAPNAAAISSSGFAPGTAQESAILVNLPPGAYTAIVSGFAGGTGVGIVEVFEVDHPEVPLANISTRGQILTGNDVMIGGFVIQGNGPQTVVIRARGPSLVPFGITNAIANPTMQLVRSSDQVTLDTNDDWQAHASSGSVSASGFAPSNSFESAIYTTLQPGAYTVVVSGVGGGTGVGIVEVFIVP